MLNTAHSKSEPITDTERPGHVGSHTTRTQHTLWSAIICSIHVRLLTSFNLSPRTSGRYCCERFRTVLVRLCEDSSPAHNRICSDTVNTTMTTNKSHKSIKKRQRHNETPASTLNNYNNNASGGPRMCSSSAPTHPFSLLSCAPRARDVVASIKMTTHPADKPQTHTSSI